MNTSPITLEESKRLIDLEKLIEAGKQTFIEVGNALAEIRDARLYKADFKTFEEYCVKKWGWTKQHCYRLIECAPIAKSNPQVTSINQARELAKVPREQREAVIKTAVAKAKSTGRELTAKDIQTAASPAPPTSSPANLEPESVVELVKTHCPRAKTQRHLQSWYINAQNEKRGKFLNLIFTLGKVVEVADKAEFKARMDFWFENDVKVAK